MSEETALALVAELRALREDLGRQLERLIGVLEHQGRPTNDFQVRPGAPRTKGGTR